MGAQGRLESVKGWIGSFYPNPFSLVSLTIGLGLLLLMYLIITLFVWNGVQILAHMVGPLNLIELGLWRRTLLSWSHPRGRLL